MRVKYFAETDTMYLELGVEEPAETKEVSENLSVDFDKEGRIVALTIEHAKGTRVATDFSYEVVGAEEAADLSGKKRA